MRNMESVLLGSVFAFGLLVGYQAEAEAQDCSMAKWDGAAPTVPVDAVGSPDSTPAVARYSEYCGLAVSSTGYVQTPATSDARYFGRFYVHLDSGITGTSDILIAYDGANPLFTIGYDSADGEFDFNSVPGGNTSVAAVAGEWNLVEFEFNSVSDLFNVWVNGEWDFDPNAPSYVSSPVTFSSGSGTVTSVQLGAPNGVTGGALTFDAYEAHRTTNVGALIACDADASGDPDINILDILAVIDERFGSPSTLAPGQPDCNRDGAINLTDILATIDVAFPSQP